MTTCLDWGAYLKVLIGIKWYNVGQKKKETRHILKYWGVVLQLAACNLLSNDMK